MSDNVDLLIVGAGKIAEEHLKVALSFDLNVELIGRGKEKTELLSRQYPSVKVSSGGLDSWLSSNKCPKRAIVAVPIEHLSNICQVLLRHGIEYILVEKPLTFSIDEVENLIHLESHFNAKISIAYNRRFYSSVLKAQQLLEQDGGVKSMHFDFTEALFRINPDNYDSKTLRHWGISNSSHVIDTAFFLTGAPKSLSSHIGKGKISWHPSGDRFTGSGLTSNDSLYSYIADWSSPGRWYISVCSKNYKLVLCPMEKLQVQEYGSFDTYEERLDDCDLKYKPGFYRQFETWMGLSLDYTDNLMGLKEYHEILGIVKTICGYR